MSIKVSVIIPVYNAEKYIAQCIESLLSQTLLECEFIFINDGSIDNSRQIIEDYKNMDIRIKLINQENQGVSSARNTGLELAIGEFVGFVDADDYIKYDLYEVLYKTAKENDCDLIISNFESEMNGHKIITKYPFPIANILNREHVENNLIPYLIMDDSLNSACNKLYKKKLIEENNIRFPNGVTLGEDGIFNMHFISCIYTAIYIDYTGYYYREVTGSATRCIEKKDYFERALEVYKLELPKKLVLKIDDDKIKELKSIKLITSVISYIHVYFNPTKNFSFFQRYRYIKKMIRNKNVRDSLPIYCREYYSLLGRYEKLIINLIHKKSTVGLYFATTYSRIRNNMEVF